MGQLSCTVRSSLQRVMSHTITKEGGSNECQALNLCSVVAIGRYRVCQRGLRAAREPGARDDGIESRASLRQARHQPGAHRTHKNGSCSSRHERGLVPCPTSAVQARGGGRG